MFERHCVKAVPQSLIGFIKLNFPWNIQMQLKLTSHGIYSIIGEHVSWFIIFTKCHKLLHVISRKAPVAEPYIL